jgi:tetratricopeptide (TPR) repeat protein
MEVLERIDLTMAPVDLTALSFQDLGKRAEQHFWAGDYRRALAHYDAMFERLVLDPPADPIERRRARAGVEVNRAVALRRCGAFGAARVSAGRAVELAEGLPERQVEAYLVLASVLADDWPVQSRDAAERAVTLSHGREPRLAGLAWTEKGNALYRSGRPAEARQAYLRAQPLSRGARDHHNLTKIEGNIGSCLFDLGRVAQARARFIRAVDLARKHGDPAAEAMWLVELGRVALADGETDEADKYAQAALRIARPAGHDLTVFRAEWLLHRSCRHRRPDGSDRHRLACLRKLYARVKGNRTCDEVTEFKSQILDAGAPDSEVP